MDASTLKPAEVAVYFVKQGIAKHNDRLLAVFFKAVLAGVMLSFGGLLSEVISGGSPALTLANPGLVKILGGFVFPAGLVMIVLQGHELLTSNMMVFPMALIKRAVPWWSLPLNWIIVTFGNLVGSLFFAAILVKYSGILSAPPYPAYVTSFAVKKAVDPEWHQVFLRGIGCNWLVCAAVWMAAGARETVSKVIVIWIPIWLFVACSFDHVVANMFSVPLGIMFHAPELTVAGYIRKSLIASYLGNIVGALFVALPATYFYLGDYQVDGLREAEAGEVLQNRDESSVNMDEKNK
ncbi:Formate/nitrite transporter [Mycena indigotica]|uniref:Formate/nitrite transporter n=1 Tax=Mycena indigotica TaxID=2126181 RepID=A0A8H6WEC7_9AGAR|nr:Formate/nitrite transporter [Mycena indigotica]KAF7315584.1 Formate/nitrite transporter [Mycena indigotica]